MKIELKPIAEQVVVITGASSGIGRVTARLAAEAGACVVLSARNERDLSAAVDEIRAAGGRAVHQVADVADALQIEAVAEAALRAFGRSTRGSTTPPWLCTAASWMFHSRTCAGSST